MHITKKYNQANVCVSVHVTQPWHLRNLSRGQKSLRKHVVLSNIRQFRKKKNGHNKLDMNDNAKNTTIPCLNIKSCTLQIPFFPLSKRGKMHLMWWIHSPSSKIKICMNKKKNSSLETCQKMCQETDSLNLLRKRCNRLYANDAQIPKIISHFCIHTFPYILPFPQTTVHSKIAHLSKSVKGTRLKEISRCL